MFMHRIIFVYDNLPQTNADQVCFERVSTLHTCIAFSHSFGLTRGKISYKCALICRYAFSLRKYFNRTRIRTDVRC